MYGFSYTYKFSMWDSYAFMQAASRPFPESHILSICLAQLWLISTAECTRTPQTRRPPSQISPRWIQPIILSDCSSLEHNTAGAPLALGGPIYCQVRKPRRLVPSVKATAALTGIWEIEAPPQPAGNNNWAINDKYFAIKYYENRSHQGEISTIRQKSTVSATATKQHPTSRSIWLMQWRENQICILVCIESLSGTNRSLQALTEWLVLADTSQSIDLDKCWGI